MAADFLDQLAELDVPPPPTAFDHELHEKLNRSLTALHIFDLLLRALPLAAFEFCHAIAGMLTLTITGAFPKKKP